MPNDLHTQLQDDIGYSFNDTGLIREALTHKSFGNENPSEGGRDNERLEFLGDAVLDLVVSDRLMEQFPQYREGDLSRLKSALVSEPSLAIVAKSLDLGKFLLLGKGEEQTGGRRKESLLANALEAVIAAIYLDGGLGAAGRFIHHHFAPLIASLAAEGGSLDFKTDLQELCQERSLPLPNYRVVGEFGPDHQKTFRVDLLIGDNVWGTGEGKSKKEAEQKSAREALERLHREDRSQP
jgi:ribonuclease III